MAKKIINILTVILGIVSVILAISTFSMNDGNFEYDVTYGGDAYTGIQNAAATTASNLVCVARILQQGFGSVLLIFGLYLILSNIGALLGDVKKVTSKVTPVYTEPVASTCPPAYTPEAAPVYTPAAAPAAEKWTCVCGCVNEADSKFCGTCGKPNN